MEESMLNVNARPAMGMLGFGKPIAIAAALTLALAGAAAPARADDAKDILKGMSDFLASQKSFSLGFDSSIEVITPSLEKIQFNNSGTLLLQRPNGIHVTRTGGYADVELFSDGKTATIYGKNLKKFVQMDAPGSVDQLIEALRGKGMALPGADLLLGEVYKTLSDDLLEAKHIGLGVINGVECEHLAFRQKETDWQLWVQTGAKPVPCKMVITSKTVGGSPEYTLVIKDWKADAPADATAFTFKPPEGVTKAEPAALADLDELPHAEAP
jgi:hypothetical protein